MLICSFIKVLMNS